MSRVLAIFVTLTLVPPGLTACGEDPADACGRAYAHLTALAKRRPDSDLAARFMASCVEVGDMRRLDCLLAASTPGEVLACKPQKKRPG